MSSFVPPVSRMLFISNTYWFKARPSSYVNVTDMSSSTSVPQGEPTIATVMTTSGTLAADPPSHLPLTTTTTNEEISLMDRTGFSFTEEMPSVVAVPASGCQVPSTPQEVVVKVSSIGAAANITMDEESVATTSSDIEVISTGTSVYENAPVASLPWVILTELFPIIFSFILLGSVSIAIV